MMDAYSASMLVQANAVMVRVAGMQAENEHRVACGNSISYGEEAFEAQAKTLDWLSFCLSERQAFMDRV